MSGEEEHVKRKGTITKHFVVGQLPPELIIISGSLAQHLQYHSNLVKLLSFVELIYVLRRTSIEIIQIIGLSTVWSYRVHG